MPSVNGGDLKMCLPIDSHRSNGNRLKGKYDADRSISRPFELKRIDSRYSARFWRNVQVQPICGKSCKARRDYVYLGGIQLCLTDELSRK